MIPLLPLSMGFSLVVDLWGQQLPSWHISCSIQRVYMLEFSITIKLSVVAAICWSPIMHLAERIFWSIMLIYTSKRCIVQFSMIKNTNPTKCLTMFFMWDNCNPVRNPFI
jgi:hypothetical protein